MDPKKEWRNFALMALVFAACFYLPVGGAGFDNAVLESLHLVKWYAREHIVLCLVPAFFIAGAIGIFISQASVMKYLGPNANKLVAYGVASVSGTILAVCSCTVLPLFAGIYRMGAGLGPACAFLYSGPAINVLAIVLTARILGLELGIARAVGAILFSVVAGALMHLFFRGEEKAKAQGMAGIAEPEVARPLWQNALYFAAMVGILVFANWGAPNSYNVEMLDGSHFRGALISAPENPKAPEAIWKFKKIEGEDAGAEISIRAGLVGALRPEPGLWTSIWQEKWHIAAFFGILLGIILVLWFGASWKRIASVAILVATTAFLLPSEGMWILIPFGVGVGGLCWVTTGCGGELRDWFDSSWTFAKQILPLLLAGVLVSGFLLGRNGHEGIIPSEWISNAVGGNSLRANFLASFVGAFMYFATLTEVPILQGLIGSGMGKGPALALLLAGPALSLPNMLVLGSIIGVKKTVVFVSIVIVLATLTGMLYGAVGG